MIGFDLGFGIVYVRTERPIILAATLNTQSLPSPLHKPLLQDKLLSDPDLILDRWGKLMTGRFLVAACAAGGMAMISLAPQPAQAQSASAIFGGLAGGVLGGVIAGSIAAQAARERPVVVYRVPTRTVRVIHEVRRAPIRKVARARQRPMQPAAGPSGAQVVNVSADPFASSQGSATTAVSQAR